MEDKDEISKKNRKDETSSLVMDEKMEFKGHEFDGLKEMVKAIKKSLGPRRAS